MLCVCIDASVPFNRCVDDWVACHPIKMLTRWPYEVPTHAGQSRCPFLPVSLGAHSYWSVQAPIL